MSNKNELQQLNNKLDKSRHKLAAAQERDDQDKVEFLQREITTMTRRIEKVKARQSGELSGKSAAVKAMAFNRVLTKAEQADMGALKKSVKGLVVVHPMTALGREMGVDKVTGYAFKAF